MAISLMRYRPDTCGCVIIQTHDPANLSVPIVNSSVESKCPAHAALSDADVLLTVSVAGEIGRKNRVRNQLNAVEGIEPSWTWTGTGTARVLVMTTGLSAAKRSTHQAWCNTNVGAGKVVIQ